MIPLKHPSEKKKKNSSRKNDRKQRNKPER